MRIPRYLRRTPMARGAGTQLRRMTNTGDEAVLAARVVNHMMDHDAFSRWLGIELVDVLPREVRIRMTVRAEMTNGFGVGHGGITFSFADSAFAFACNNRNNLSLALDTSINFTKTTRPGDVLTAIAEEKHNGRTTGLYHITVSNQHDEEVAFFKGTCFRTGKTLV